jgi:predicted peroxiredoxin
MNGIQVLLSTGPENEEKAILAFAFALGAIAVESEVHVFLTMQGAAWIDSSHGNTHIVHGFESIDFYWNHLLEMGAKIEGCSGCVENYLNSHGESAVSQRRGYELVGLSTASMRACSMQTVHF